MIADLAKDGVDFNYIQGGADWGTILSDLGKEKYPLCSSGESQSPVNIVIDETARSTEL